MQEIALIGLRPSPLPASPLDAALERRGAGGDGRSGIGAPDDDELLAQFEEWMPSAAVDPQRHADSGTPEASIAGIGMPRSIASAGGALAQGGAGWLRAAGACPEPDAPSAEFSVHHSRIGVVHVQQSPGRDGGSVTLRTDDALLRERLRHGVAGLQAVMTDAFGRGPDVAIES